MRHFLAPCLVCAVFASPAESAPPKTLPIAGARSVVAAVVVAATKNATAPAPLKGDKLTELYVRTAAAAARKLPADQASQAFLLAIGISLDTAALLRKSPVTGDLWKRIETDKERSQRLKVIGMPTLHGRHDLAQHFAVSAALTAALGARAAETAGLLKELLDANGGSGFSFADLAADLSGIKFAEVVLASHRRLEGLERSFVVSEHCLAPRGLVEDLQIAEFERRYGSVADKRFRTELEALRKRVRGLPAYWAP